MWDGLRSRPHICIRHNLGKRMLKLCQWDVNGSINEQLYAHYIVAAITKSSQSSDSYLAMHAAHIAYHYD